MADFDSSLPVRTQNNGDVVVEIADGTTPSQKLAVDAAGKITVKLDDAAGNGITSTTIVAKQALDVNVANAISTGAVDNSSFTYSTSTEQTIGGVFNDTGATVTSGNQAAARITAQRGLHVNLRNSSGTEEGDTNAHGLFVRPGDGTNAQAYTVTGAALVDGSATTQPVSGTVTANQGTSPWIGKDQSDGPVSPGAVAAFSGLVGGQFNTVLPTLTNTQQAALQVDASGRLIISPLSGSSVTVTNFPTTVDTNYGTVGASTIRTAAQIGNATGAADFNAGATGAQTLRVTANQGTANATPWNENIAQIAGAVPSATNALPTQIATAGAFVSSSNPLPVTLSDTVGTPINDYKDASAIGSGASDNHDYTVTAAKTLTLTSVSGSASGKAKMLISIETGVATGVFTTRFVHFNSTATPDMYQPLTAPIQVAAGVRVRVVMSNRDLLAEDLYSTISGSES